MSESIELEAGQVRRTLISTVGTSLLTNHGWKSGQALPPKSDVESWLDGDPSGSCAETHSWLRLGCLEDDADDEVALVHSDTDAGAFCAGELKTWLEKRGVSARVERVEGLGKRDEKAFRNGLRRLVQKLFACIHAARNSGRAAELVATGGFKAEIAYANTVGMLSNTPVHYIYQEFHEIVTLEPLPLEWRRDAFRDVRQLLFDLAADLQPAHKVEPWWHSHPVLLPLLERADDEYGLSPVGEMVVEMLRTEPVSWPEASTRHPDEKKNMQPGHHRPEGWEAAVDIIARVPQVTSIRYEGANSKPRSSVWVSDGEAGLLGAVLVGRNERLGLRVETTAQGQAQSDLVAGHLRRVLGWK